MKYKTSCPALGFIINYIISIKPSCFAVRSAGVFPAWREIVIILIPLKWWHYAHYKETRFKQELLQFSRTSDNIHGLLIEQWKLLEILILRYFLILK